MASTSERGKARGYTPHGVRYTAPKEKGGYFRITWMEGGRRHETTAKDDYEAQNKLVLIEKRLATENGHRSLLTIGEMVNAYVNPEKGKLTRPKWTPKHERAVKQILFAEVYEQLKDLQCGQLELHHLETIVERSRSTSMAEHWVKVLNTFVRWGHNNGWIISDPTPWISALNRKLGYIREENESSTHARGKDVVTSGESRMFVHKDQIPSHEQVHALGKAAAEVSGRDWYELLINLAAYSGLRDGEIFDLDIDHVDTKTRDIYVETQRLDDAGNLSRTFPKKRKRRKTTYVEVTPEGYELARKLKERVELLRKMPFTPTVQNGEQRKLLFPNTRGGWVSNSNFAKRVRIPAQEAAGWPRQVLTDEVLNTERQKRDERARRKEKKEAEEAKAAKERGDVPLIVEKSKKNVDEESKEQEIEATFIWNFHSLRHVFCSYMINELGCAPIDVSIAAGHENISTTLSMYVSASNSSLDRLKASTARIKKASKKPKGAAPVKKTSEATSKTKSWKKAK